MEKVTYKGYTIEIQNDEDGIDPREDDNLGTMLCFHKRYTLGDKNHGIKSSDYQSFKEMRAAIEKEQGSIVSIPLYLYDHSGITMNTTGFSNIDSTRWDWGQLGFIYVTHKKLREQMQWKKLTKARLLQAEEYLRGEVKTYDQYLRGDVYGYSVKAPDGEDIEEGSCWGFFGYDNEESGLLESARAAIDYEISRRLKDEGIQEELAIAAA